MRRAASATLARLGRQTSRELGGGLPRGDNLPALGHAVFSLAAAEEARQQGGQPKRSRRFGAHLSAALHLASVQQHLHLHEHDHSQQPVGLQRTGSVRDPEMHPHKHHSHRAPWLRAFVLGANDGLVSTSSLLMGVGAASSDHTTIVLSGVAGLVGGALSMAVGEYISVSSQRDAEAADIEAERLEQLKGPQAREWELEELTQIYVERGLPYRLAREVAEALTENDVIRAHARDELGIDVDNLARPLQAAIVSALTFSCGAGIPLLGAAFVTDWKARTGIVIACTTLGLAGFGSLAAWLGGANKLRAAMRVLLGGWAAMGVTYGFGTLFEAAAA